MRQSDKFQARVRHIAICAIAAFGVAFLYLVYHATQFDDLRDINALDMAQVARNLSRGDGFTTKLIRPLTLAISQSIEGHPELTMSPLHPLLAAGFFKLFGANARVMAWECGICFLLTIGITYWLAIRVFDTQVAGLAVAMAATNMTLLQYAISGLETSLLTLLVTLLFFLLFMHWKAQRHRLLLSAVCGAVAGLIYLTQYAWVIIWLPAVVVIFFNAQNKRKFANVAVFVIISVLVVMPWFVRNYNITGNPLFTYRWTEAIMGTWSHSGNTVYRSWDVPTEGVLAFTIQSPREVYHKMRNSLLYLRPTVTSVGGPFIVAFFWVAILIPLGGVGFERVRKALYASFVLLIVLLSVLGPSPRLVTPLSPIVTVIGLALFCQLLDRRLGRMPERERNRWRALGIGLLVAVHVLPLALTMMPGFPTYYAHGAALQRAADELDCFVEEGRPVVTDVPWVVAWYGDRPALWLPHRAVDMRRIEQEVGRIKYLVLTPALVRVADSEKATGWARAWQRALREDIRYETWIVHQRLANAGWILFRRVPE